LVKLGLIILVPYVILAISLAVLWAVVGKSPPRLTLASLARLLPANTSMIAIIGTSVVGPLLALWFRGAILAFSLRHAPVITEDATP
jgi:hypothetical protein